MIVVGLMSGTSADGVDAAVVEISGQPPSLNWRLLAHHAVPHPSETRKAIFQAFVPGSATVEDICRLNFSLGRAFAEAAIQAISAAGLVPSEVNLIGSHGQTIWHQPGGPEPCTLQLGEPAVIAELTGIPVVSNLRVRDMAAGGQGAPLVAYVDQLLFSHPRLTRALQNIGGIANVTFLPPTAEGAAKQHGPFAFDTGPGNMLIDDAVGRATGGVLSYDRDGELAARGGIDESLLAELLVDPYFTIPPPKTTGREYFGVQYGRAIWDRGIARGLAPVDIIATVTAFTARSIADAYRRYLPTPPDEVILSGGGAANGALVAMLRQALAPAKILTSDDLGMPGQAKEAIAFAVLAYETCHNRPGNLPAATGARRPVVLGTLTPAAGGAFRLQRAPQTATAQRVRVTESRNPRSEDIDSVPTETMLRIINSEDQRVPEVVETQIPAIARAVDAIADRMRRGGRLIYLGAGTSGRLGVLDASECPPTFSTAPGQVLGLIAGGLHALTHATEGAEDDEVAGERDVVSVGVGPDDSVVGIAASGHTPYVLAGLRAAQRAGALTVSVAGNHPSPMADISDIGIALVVGPEVITGSTRMKAGTSQKLVLNMISTGVMIRLGKTLGNLMVDVQATNLKLRERARRIVEEACGVDETRAAALLEATGGEVKTAIVVGLSGLTPEDARAQLAAANGIVRAALEPAR